MKFSSKKIEIESRVMKALSDSPDLSNAGNLTLKILCEILKWNSGEMWAVNSEKSGLQLVAFWPQKSYGPDEKNRELAHEIWRKKSSYCSKNSCGSVIQFKDEVMGVILFGGIQKEFPNDKIVELLIDVTHQIGAFIKRRRVEGDLLYFGQQDFLTNLPSRMKFESDLNQAIANAEWRHHILAVLYLDLDFFKKINDVLGYEKGDLLLKEVGRRLKVVVREADCISRFGGDEFAIFLRDLKSKEDASIVAEKILSSLKKPFILDGHTFKITASIGISIYPEDGSDVKTLLKNAGIAMDMAKKSGKNKAVYREEKKLIRQKRKIENDLYHALEEKEFVLYYQPIANVSDNKISGFEALLRWKREDGTMWFPSEFISIAEESSLILYIGNWIIRSVCLEIKKHPDIFKSPVSINISVRQLYENFLSNVSQILKETQVDSKKIIFEVTESMLIPQIENTTYILNELKKMGIHVSLDDFGTGYSSLTYIQYFAASSIKIDRSFISGLPDNRQCTAIVDAIIAMAHAINLTVIAEGVETEAQLAYLVKKKCDKYQGFLYSKPLSTEDLIQFVKDKQ